MAMGSIVPSLIAWGLAVGIVGMVWFSIPAIYIVHNYGPVAVKFVKYIIYGYVFPTIAIIWAHVKYPIALVIIAGIFQVTMGGRPPQREDIRPVDPPETDSSSSEGQESLEEEALEMGEPSLLDIVDSELEHDGDIDSVRLLDNQQLGPEGVYTSSAYSGPSATRRVRQIVADVDADEDAMEFPPLTAGLDTVVEEE
jgi:hypothetical protein